MYEEFAEVYDRLMDDFDYPAWAKYYAGLIGITRGKVCECGCGTGSMLVELARSGLSMTGVDISEEMLRVAADKARRRGAAVRLVRQDMQKLQLTGPQDAILACCDSVNYLTTPQAVRDFFRSAHRQLRPGGV